ncbi:MAG: hypothetical protein K8R85_12800 [Bacteroidetes bacterium]|nr:hypothetical protein [Bacteroidota bacterium]
MENIIKTVSEKAGISELQAKLATETLISLLKSKMPGGIGAQVETFLKLGTDSNGGIANKIKEKISEVMGK